MTSVQSNYDARQLIDALPIEAGLLDWELTVKYSNQAYRDLWGLENAWIAHRPSYRVVLEWLRDNRRLPEQMNFCIYLDTQLSNLRIIKGAGEDALFLTGARTLSEKDAFSEHGFGLTIVKELLGQHGGSFSLTSRPNRETIVTCRLPSA